METVTSMLSKPVRVTRSDRHGASRFSLPKVFGVLMFMVLLPVFALLVSCGGSGPGASGENSQKDSRPLVLTTVFASYDFAREVAGSNAEVKMLVPPGTETHSFEPTPQDMIDLENCDLFIYVGGESDAWVNELLAAVDNPDMQTIRMLDLVETVLEDESILVEGVRQQEDGHEHGEADADGDAHGHADGDADDPHAEDAHNEHGAGHADGDADGDVDGDAEWHAHGDADDPHAEDTHGEHADEAEATHGAETDEHVWTSPKNAIVISEEIAARMEQIDPKNLSSYDENLSTYREELTALDGEFQRIVDAGNRKLLVFGDRFAFRYFVDEYGLECKAAFPGCSTATQPSAKTVAALVDYVAAEQVPVVFYRELSDHRLADSICLETGATAMELNSCHNVSKADFDAGVSYLSIMYENAAALEIALR